MSPVPGLGTSSPRSSKAEHWSFKPVGVGSSPTGGTMRELVHRVTIKDCDVQTLRGSGKGGQNRNKRDTAVRITHRPSGAVGYAEDERHQWQNKKLAFRRMGESAAFQRWARQDVVLPEASSTERVRTYNLIDRRVIDHRTGCKTSDVEGVLNGNLDCFYGV